MKQLNSISQLLRHGIVGTSINLIGYSIYLLMTYIGLNPKIVMSTLYIIATTVGFFTSQKWIFQHKGNFFGTGMRYIIAHALGYLLNLSILIIAVDHLGHPHYWVQAISIFIVAFFLFLLCKFFVFKSKGYTMQMRQI